MATVTYAFTPGQIVYVVNASAFGVAKATVMSVKITANPLVLEYVVQYFTSGRAPTTVTEDQMFATTAAALVAYEPLIV